MEVYLCFRRDDKGVVRLFHAYDEHDARSAAMLRWGVPSLVEALQALEGQPWAMVKINTDDPILRDKPAGWGEVAGPHLLPVNFVALLPPDDVVPCPTCEKTLSPSNPHYATTDSWVHKCGQHFTVVDGRIEFGEGVGV